MTTNTTDPGAVPTDGVRIPVPGGGHLWADRNGTGSPVVLLHGAGMDSRLWDPVVPRLAGRHEVIRFDARGLGRSTEPGAPFSDVEDLRSVLDHFGHRRAALVGLSMGGETSIDFALAHPDRVTALALVGASVGGHSWPTTPELSAYAVARRERDTARLAELELSIWASLGRTAPGGELIEAMVAHNAERRIISELHLAPSAESDAEARLGTITAPTLVVHGDRDHPEIGVIAERLAADLPVAHARRIPDADHYLPLRTPERLTELLLAHLARS
ncbi:alpha/beta hydrolase [Kitasatospora sp. CM 4170]|uniref:Alpha/beta fold hydrolase n=1 Tax=Kitasatospora aburaviensis TaxID=67265 RepID=A0ABW1EQG8_9ACTN|nr:alpha/beta hydrolase [Kitasatospora sp. CM 4170]WNM44359.1 alpha/beta hydrolase [Kitasatospora sp. CM 4170]